MSVPFRCEPVTVIIFFDPVPVLAQTCHGNIGSSSTFDTVLFSLASARHPDQNSVKLSFFTVLVSVSMRHFRHKYDVISSLVKFPLFPGNFNESSGGPSGSADGHVRLRLIQEHCDFRLALSSAQSQEEGDGNDEVILSSDV